MIDSPPIHCSLAHSGEYVVCAAAEVPVGVDVERLRGIPPTDALVRRECTEPERRRLSAADPADRERLFVRAWTRKEALSKAVGHGHGLSFAALESGARRTWVKDTRLSLFDLDLPAPYWGALAVGGRRPRLEIRR
jgi:4'-phosphopantetheinyl transferase